MMSTLQESQSLQRSSRNEDGHENNKSICPLSTVRIDCGHIARDQRWEPLTDSQDMHEWKPLEKKPDQS